MHPLSVDHHGTPECAYCHEASFTVRRRRMPWDVEEDGQWLCAACWGDVQKALNKPPEFRP